MEYSKLSDLKEIKGKHILVRADFNVPIVDGVVLDPFRIDKTMPTIDYLKKAGAKTILISHIENGDTLVPVYEYLKTKIAISFCQDCLDDCSGIKAMKDGDVLLCENIRLYSSEKTNDADLGKRLADLADIYVNDAFSVSHRKHASVCRIPEYLPSYAGLLFDSELTHLSASFNPPRPFLFILAGAKFETKIPLITKFADIADSVFVGGALAHNFFKEEGFSVGQSLVSSGDYNLKGLISKGKIMLPSDAIVVRSGKPITINIKDIVDTDIMYDDGPNTLEVLKNEIQKAEFVLWNGPLGNYENGYKAGTLELAKIISESGAKSVVGGGDTLAAIAELRIEDKIGFVSTAGGAMLDFLANGTLPGLEALKNSKK